MCAITNNVAVAVALNAGWLTFFLNFLRVIVAFAAVVIVAVRNASSLIYANWIYGYMIFIYIEQVFWCVSCTKGNNYYYFYWVNKFLSYIMSHKWHVSWHSHKQTTEIHQLITSILLNWIFFLLFFMIVALLFLRSTVFVI